MLTTMQNGEYMIKESIDQSIRFQSAIQVVDCNLFMKTAKMTFAKLKQLLLKLKQLLLTLKHGLLLN